jgi:hypothetical protein
MSKQSFVSVYYVYSMSTDDIWCRIVQLIFIMECDLVYEDLEVCFLFKTFT